MNDNERELWVMNDESLYRWWKSERIGITTFIRQNRKELTKLIQSVLDRPPTR